MRRNVAVPVQNYEKSMVAGIILTEPRVPVAMNYLESVAYIDSLSPTLERPSLARMQAFLQYDESTRNRYPVFHVGGTNGKGSTVAILDAVLRQCQISVGRFTGPHLLRWNERFHVDGKAITDEEFCTLATDVRQRSHAFAQAHPDLGALTWFEFLTVMALRFFTERKVQVAVFEVGLGGRFDATTVVLNVLCSAVTNIDLDHTHILCETIKEIAFEKGGIFKPGIPALTAAPDETALNELRQRAHAAGTNFYTAQLPDHLYAIESGGSAKEIDDALWTTTRQKFNAACRQLNLRGTHQRANALVALASIYLAAKNTQWLEELLRERLLKAEKGDALPHAFGEVYWPGRMQMIEELNLVLDGAHNPAGARILRSALDEQFTGSTFSFVFSCFANKNAREMVSALVRPGDKVFISEASTRRATCSKEELAAIAHEMGAKSFTFSSILLALESALKDRDAREPVIATGSFATVRETMTFLGWHSVEDGLPECAKILSEGVASSGVGRSVS
jgi:dihydrofolate synthase/folylpolyglutamate synthase